MKTELIDVSATEKQIVFEVPADAVEAEIARVARDYARAARVPGFRPGKAPAAIVRQRFRDRILHDVAHELVPRLLDDTLRERALDPVDTPDIRDLSLKEGEPLTFTAVFETVPPIDPIDLSTLTLRRQRIEVADEAVDAMLERLRERHARFDPVADRASEAGDVLTIDLVRRSLAPVAEGTTPGDPERLEGISVEIGAESNPHGFDAEVVGLSGGEGKTFVLRFPDDHHVEALRGVDVEYAVDVKAVKRKVLPALDDEFAKDLGDFESMAVLRERVRDDLRREAERREEREMRGDLLKQLAERVPAEVPEALVEREIDRRIEELVRRLIEQQVDPMRAGLDWQKFRADQRPAALDTVRSTIALDDIARREGLEVTPAELDAEFERAASLTGRSARAVRAKVEKDGGLARLVAGLRRDKAVAHALSRATIVGT